MGPPCANKRKKEEEKRKKDQDKRKKGEDKKIKRKPGRTMPCIL